jgi:predicted kinase
LPFTFRRMTPLVIVCGPPAVGKTTLAKALSTHLGLPIISKDALKEALMDHLGGSPAVGAAAFAVQFAMAHELLRAGVGIILEGAFFADRLQPEFGAKAVAGGSSLIS